MKQLDSLTEADFIIQPVWEHWYIKEKEYVKASDLIDLDTESHWQRK